MARCSSVVWEEEMFDILRTTKVTTAVGSDSLPSTPLKHGAMPLDSTLNSPDLHIIKLVFYSRLLETRHYCPHPKNLQFY